MTQYLLIHVGKCGGGNIFKKLGTSKYAILKVINSKVCCCEIIDDREVISNRTYKLGYIHTHNHIQEHRIQILNECSEYILLCRDPITRFISIFNAWYEIYYLKNNPKEYTTQDEIKLKSHYPEYDKYFDVFKSANHLAESLNIENAQYDFAVEAVGCIAHFRQGIKYYLQNEEVIKKNIKKFKYVLRIEHYEDDYAKIDKEILKKYNLTSLSYDDFIKNLVHKTNKTHLNQYLSSESIQNIKDFYKGDYDIFDILVKYNIIEQDYIDKFI